MPSLAALERLRSLGPVFRAGEAVGAGVSWRDLYELRDGGLVVELSRGLYQLGDGPGLDQVDFVAVCARAPRGMVCLRSALAYWDLSDEVPGWVDLAVPSGAHRPRIDYPPTKVHVFQARTFDLGKARVPPVRSGVGFVVTGPERTVVDCFRARHRVGDDLAAGGLRRYLRKPGAKPVQVLELAGALRVRAPVLQALRLLQE
jgi:hypothetical protein